MSLMGHLPTIAFCYLVCMHYTESGLAFCISEWADLSGYKQFYLYCAQLHRVNIRMNFSSERKAPNLWFRGLGAASAVLLVTGALWMFADVLGNSGVTWGTLLVSAVAPYGDRFPQRPPRCNRLFCLLFAHWFHLLPVFRISFSAPIDIWWRMVIALPKGLAVASGVAQGLILRAAGLRRKCPAVWWSLVPSPSWSPLIFEATFNNDSLKMNR